MLAFVLFSSFYAGLNLYSGLNSVVHQGEGRRFLGCYSYLKVIFTEFHRHLFAESMAQKAYNGDIKNDHGNIDWTLNV